MRSNEVHDSILNVAEKPSVAKEISKCLSQGRSQHVSDIQVMSNAGLGNVEVLLILFLNLFFIEGSLAFAI